MIWLALVAIFFSSLCGNGNGLPFGKRLVKRGTSEELSDTELALWAEKGGDNRPESWIRDKYEENKPVDREAECVKDKEVAQLVSDQAKLLCKESDSASKSGLTIVKKSPKCQSATERANELAKKAYRTCGLDSSGYPWIPPLLSKPADYLGYMKYRDGLKDGSIKELEETDLPPGWENEVTDTDERPWWVDHFRNGRKLSTGMKLWYGDRKQKPDRRPLIDYMPGKMQIDFLNWKFNQEEQAENKLQIDKQ